MKKLKKIWADLEGNASSYEDVINKHCDGIEVCYIRAINLLRNENSLSAIDITFCEDYLAKEEKVDIYKIADRITETVKQVVLANLRMICDNEGD